MSKTASINSRIEPNLKAQAEAVFAMLGLTASDAITLFYKQVTLQQGIPFALKIPNAQTLAAMAEGENPKKLKRYTTVDELFHELGI